MRRRLSPDCLNDYRADYRAQTLLAIGLWTTHYKACYSLPMSTQSRGGANRRESMKIVYWLVGAVILCMIANLGVIASTL